MFIDFLEREEGGERKRNIDVREKYPLVTSHMHHSYSTNHNLDMCPDRESNLQPFVVWDDAPASWATWPLPSVFLLWCKQEKKWKVLGTPETLIQVINIITTIIIIIIIIIIPPFSSKDNNEWASPQDICSSAPSCLESSPIETANHLRQTDKLPRQVQSLKNQSQGSVCTSSSNIH